MSVVVLAAAWVLGNAAFRLVRVRGGAGLHPARLALGLVLVAGCVQVAGPAGFTLTDVGLFAAAGLGLAYELRRARRGVPTRRGTFPVLHAALAGLAALIAALVLWRLAVPVTHFEAIAGSLSLAKEHAARGQLGPLPGHGADRAPLWTGLLAVVYARGGETGALVLAWGLAVAGLWAVYHVAAALGGRGAGVMASAAWAGAPVFAAQIEAVLPELLAALIILGAAAVLLAGRGGWPTWAVSGFLVGSAYGSGVALAGLVPVFAVGAALLAKRGCRIQAFVVHGAAALLAAAPWVVVVPWAGPGGTGLIDLLWFPWDVAMRPWRVGGWTVSPGPWVLAALPVAVLAGGPRIRAAALLVLLAGLILALSAGLESLRLVPVYGVGVAVASAGAARAVRPRWLAAGLVLVAALAGLAFEANRLRLAWPVVAGHVAHVDYLAARVPAHPAYRWLNENKAPGRPVLALTPETYYIAGATAGAGPGGGADWRGLAAADRRAWLAARGIRYVAMPSRLGAADGAYAHLAAELRRDPAFRQVYSVRVPGSTGRDVVDIFEVHHE